MPNFSYPPMEQRRVIGKRLTRVDGTQKASGKAKYNSDVKMEGMLYSSILYCPHAHAVLKSLDTSAAEKLPGVIAVYVMTKPGTEIQWAMTEIAAVAAEREEVARDAVRLIQAVYDVQPHFVREDDLNKAQSAGQPPSVALELASEAAADMVLVRVNVCGGDLQLLGQVAANRRYALGGRAILNLVALPLHNLPVRFQAAVRNHRSPLGSFCSHLGALHGRIELALRLLLQRLAAVSRFLR